MSPNRTALVLKRFYIAYAVGAFVLYGLLMAFAFPWWQASNHPVILTLGAAGETRIELGFDPREEALPVVPMGEIKPWHWQWGTELPPRPDYDLYLHFPGGTKGEVLLSGIKVLTLSPRRSETNLNLDFLTEHNDVNLRVRRLEEGWGITADPGSRLAIPNEIGTVPVGHWLRDALKATVGYIFVAGISLLILATALRFPDRLEFTRRRIPAFENVCLLAGVLIGAAAHLHLVGQSMPDYWPADSTSYAMKSVSLATEGSYDTGTHEYELNRMPGFPVFMAAVFKLWGWNLGAVTLAQGLFFCMAVLLLALAMRRLIHGHLIGLVALAALLSPPAVWASRQIATESTFASAWVLGLAAFLFLWQRQKAWRWFGWVLFGLAVTLAVSIRPNGILLLALPGFLFIGAAWWSISVRGSTFWRIPIFWRTVAEVAIPCAMVLLFVLAWSWRNHESRGYGKPTDLTEIVHANAPFFAGIFDIRAAKTPAEYRWFVNERANSGYWFHGWSLRKYRFREITNQYHDIEDRSIRELEAELAAFNAASKELIPLRAKLVGWGRVAGWGLFFPRIAAHTTDPLNQNYRVLSEFPDDKRAEHIRRNLKWATRNIEKSIAISEADPDPLVGFYNRTLVPVYPWIYRILFLTAVFGWLLGIAERKYLASALIVPYLLNILLNVYFMYIIGRYVQVLDVSLWMAALAGLACISSNTLQEPTTEKDRRCMPPIKPKRLLTRFANASGTGRST